MTAVSVPGGPEKAPFVGSLRPARSSSVSDGNAVTKQLRLVAFTTRRR